MSITGTRIRIAHTAAIAVVLVSGSYALIALISGSPAEFGIALALCGAGWVGADRIERWADDAVRPVPHPRKMRSQSVLIGRGESCSRRLDTERRYSEWGVGLCADSHLDCSDRFTAVPVAYSR